MSDIVPNEPGASKPRDRKTKGFTPAELRSMIANGITKSHLRFALRIARGLPGRKNSYAEKESLTNPEPTINESRMMLQTLLKYAIPSTGEIVVSDQEAFKSLAELAMSYMDEDKRDVFVNHYEKAVSAYALKNPDALNQLPHIDGTPVDLDDDEEDVDLDDEV